MDCSKTEVFLRELKRLAEKKDVSVKEMTIGNRLCVLDPGLWDNETPIIIQEIIQKWSDEHPQETVLEHFRKILPHIKLKNTIPLMCVRDIDTRIFFDCSNSACCDCWNRPYEEAIRESEE